MKGRPVGKPVHFRGGRPWSVPGALSLAALLVGGTPRVARAENFLDTTFEDYSESGGRIGVHTQALDASEDLTPDLNLRFTLLNDAIAGASPTGQPAPAGSTQVPLAHLSDHRKAEEADLARQLGPLNVAVGVSASREHDYVSRGWSLTTRTDFNARNTELLVGIAGHDDEVETFFFPAHAYQHKEAFTGIVGVRQLLDPLTVVTVNVSWGRETGYLDDQYKVVQKTEELVAGSFFPLVFAESRPGARDRGDGYLSVNRAVPQARGALEASYRYYADTFGVRAQTAEIRWIQKLGAAVTVSPDLRLSRQGAARFYYYNLDATAVVPTAVPDPQGPAYSSDYRLSAFDAVSGGLRVTWKLAAHLQLEGRVERYAMRGRDGVTPASAYPRANVFSAGARILW